MALLGHIVHFVGNRSPQLQGLLEVDGVPVDLTGATVKLQMRPVNGTTLKVDAAATVDTSLLPNANVRYAWAAADVDTAGFYVAWWRVTFVGGTVQDSPEFLVEIAAHGPGANGEYVSSAELKETLGLKQDFADPDLERSVMAASKVIDTICYDAPFTLGTPGETRYYTTPSAEYVLVDPIVSLTSVTVGGVPLVLGTDFAVVDGVLRSLGVSGATGLVDGEWVAGRPFPRNVVNGVAVTGQFGWETIPAEVKSATIIIASRILRRVREAPFGVVGFGFDGAAVRITNSDPDIAMLLGNHMRDALVE